MANVVEITDFSAKELDIYARCTKCNTPNSREDPSKEFLSQSPVIARALDAGCLPVNSCGDRSESQGEVQIFYSAVRRRPVYATDHAVISKSTGF